MLGSYVMQAEGSRVPITNVIFSLRCAGPLCPGRHLDICVTHCVFGGCRESLVLLYFTLSAAPAKKSKRPVCASEHFERNEH